MLNLHFIFYVGWLKDDNDFEVNLIVDDMQNDHHELLKDQF